MDKVTCIAFFLHQSSMSQDIKEKAIQLLNGDVSISDLKRNAAVRTNLILAESWFKKNKMDKTQVQNFVEEFLLIEA
nr:hypothetical protein [Neobacillus sp. Marseille-Q6967]